MTALPAVLSEVEQATGPDRGLDADIAEALGMLPQGCVRDTQTVLDGCFGPRGHAVWWASPTYTASIDAALALVDKVLPGWSYILDARPVNRTDGAVRVRLYAPGRIAATFDPPVVRGSHAAAFGSTAPLAILAALLKSILAQDAGATP